MNVPSDRTLQQYFNEINEFPRLTPDEETELARRIQAGDDAARAAMIAANLRLVVFLAKEFQQSRVPFGDLIAEGNVGLIRAVEKYQPDRGAKFSTYASIWIRQAVRAAVVKQEQTIRIPAHAMAKLVEVSKRRAQWLEDKGREATDAELGRLLDMDPQEVAHLKGLTLGTVSLDAASGSEEGKQSLEEVLPDERAEVPDASCEWRDLRAKLRRLLAGLNPRERDVVESRYGLQGTPKSLDEIGRKYGVTKERVRQLQEIATRKLRLAWAAWESTPTPAPQVAAG